LALAVNPDMGVADQRQCGFIQILDIPWDRVSSLCQLLLTHKNDKDVANSMPT
jgi:hypothetical protein